MSLMLTSKEETTIPKRRYFDTGAAVKPEASIVKAPFSL